MMLLLLFVSVFGAWALGFEKRAGVADLPTTFAWPSSLSRIYGATIPSSSSSKSSFPPLTSSPYDDPASTHSNLKENNNNLKAKHLLNKNEPHIKHVVMTKPMGKMCNQVDELVYAASVARKYNVPLLLWGEWINLVIENLDADHFFQFMGADGNKNSGLVKFIKPDDPLINHASKGAWTMRACAARTKLSEMQAILPSKSVRKEAKHLLQAMRKTSEEYVVFVLLCITYPFKKAGKNL